MPSPFPGMNPYLEHRRVWPGFHELFVGALTQALNARLGAAYIALVEEQIYLHRLGDDAAQFLGRADVGVAASGVAREPGGAPTGVGVLAAPVTVTVPFAYAEALSRVEVRTRDGDRLVTVIEMLSPTNKRPGWHREQYLQKRAEVMHGDAHFVEIDLLRGWERMPMEAAAAPPSAYRVLVSRAEDRPDAGLWPVGLRDPLPVIPVPLRLPDPAVQVDLQERLHHVYDVGTYWKLMHRLEPEPPLGPADAEWARSLATSAVG